MKCVFVTHQDLVLSDYSGPSTGCRYCSEVAIRTVSFKEKIYHVCSHCSIRAREWLVRRWLKERGIFSVIEDRIDLIHAGKFDNGYDADNNVLTLNDGDVE